MFEDILIKVNPYLWSSKNLIEFFGIIGYEEKILVEYAKTKNLENDLNLEISIISCVISDFPIGTFDTDKLIKQIYPDKPKIIKNIKKEEPTNALFFYSFDSILDKNKRLYACYALKFYEKFTIFNTIYYIPKAILMFSLYPYFTTFYNISLNIYNYFKNKESNNKIPIEILIHFLVNCVPSPINNNLELKLFENQSPIIIKKLNGYPYIDIDMCKIFYLIPINDFIKIYILRLLEIPLYFTSSELVYLNVIKYILNILNYPFIDSNYYWIINSILKDDELKRRKKTLDPNTKIDHRSYSAYYDLKDFGNINFIIDLDKIDIKCNKEESRQSKEIYKLLKYIHHILKRKKVISHFLNDYLTNVREKLEIFKKEYEKNGGKKNSEHFFYIDNNVIDINEKIQEIFYDFILNILIPFYKDFKLNANCTKIIKNINENENNKFSEEEKIFAKYFRNTIKYKLYFDNYISNFTSIDELKLSFIFTDEYINVKAKDSKKDIPSKLKFLKFMDSFYSLNTNVFSIDYNYLKKEIYRPYYFGLNRVFKEEKKNQLFEFDKNIITLFSFFIKSKGLFKSLKIKENKEINIKSIEKISIIRTIQNHFSFIFNDDYFTIGTAIYFFSIVFPLFPSNKAIIFLQEILENLNKMIYFRRYYLYIILKSIHKYYLINKQNNNFPDLTLENIKNYCSLIKNYLILNSIIPNEEIFLFLEKILSDDQKKIKDIEDTKIKIDKNNFVFQYVKKENYEKDIPEDIIVKENNQLILTYKGQRKRYELFKDTYLIHQIVYSNYDNYFIGKNFNIVKYESKNNIEQIINIIYYLITKGKKDLACHLFNSIIVLKKLEEDLKSYNLNNNNNNINQNEENNINNNNNINENNNNGNNNIINNENKNIINENNNINNNENNNINNNENNIINNNENNIINNNENNIINNNENNIINNNENNYK